MHRRLEQLTDDTEGEPLLELSAARDADRERRCSDLSQTLQQARLPNARRPLDDEHAARAALGVAYDRLDLRKLALAIEQLWPDDVVHAASVPARKKSGETPYRNA